MNYLFVDLRCVEKWHHSFQFDNYRKNPMKDDYLKSSTENSAAPLNHYPVKSVTDI